MSLHRYTQAFEDRFQHLERLCAKLEGISNELSQSLAAVNHLTGTNQPDQVSPQTALREVAETLQSLPRALDGPIQPPVPSGPLSVSQEGPTRVSPQEDAGYRGTESDSGLHLGEDMIGSIDDDSDDDDVSPWPDQAVAKPRGFGSLVTDSYGRLRYAFLSLCLMRLRANSPVPKVSRRCDEPRLDRGRPKSLAL